VPEETLDVVWQFVSTLEVLIGHHGHEIHVVDFLQAHVLLYAEYLAFLLLELHEAGGDDREVLGADAVELVQDALHLRLLDAQDEGLDELQRGVLGTVEHHRHPAHQTCKLLDGLRLARSRVPLEADALVQLDSHADVEPALLREGSDDQALLDAALLEALLDGEGLVENVQPDVILVLLELEHDLLLLGLRAGEGNLAQVLHPQEGREHLCGPLPEFRVLLGDVLEFSHGVDDEHDLLALGGLLLGVQYAPLEFLLEDDHDAEQDDLYWLMLHPLLKGVDEVAALVASLDLVLDIGLLLALLAHECDQLALQVSLDRVLQLLEPDLHILLLLEFHDVLLESKFLTLTAGLGGDALDLLLVLFLRDLHAVDSAEELADLLLQLLGVVGVADYAQEVLIGDELETVELALDFVELVLHLLQPLLELLIQLGQLLGQFRVGEALLH